MCLFVFKLQLHLYIVFFLSVIQNIPWDGIVINIRVVIIEAILLSIPPSLLCCPFLAYFQGRSLLG
ncbi:hypothetical protein B0T17DRAFT_543935 [Bombardia bombarda]|uniref:Uncharacterized protein n=1 Tax=Bombardia bombarda TaxID=252184 RepID=A0AA39WD13_9PEZI|nr:hypothetical protein B0T17DRAFT_543935 [Bombardia bombarda]